MGRQRNAAVKTVTTYKTLRQRLPKTWYGTLITIVLSLAAGAVMLLSSGCAAGALGSASGLLQPAPNAAARSNGNLRIELEADVASEIQRREAREMSDIRIRQWRMEGGASASATAASDPPACPPAAPCPAASAAAAAAASSQKSVPDDLSIVPDHRVNALCAGLEKGCDPGYQCEAQDYLRGITPGSIWHVSTDHWFIPIKAPSYVTDQAKEWPHWQRVSDGKIMVACSDKALE